MTDCFRIGDRRTEAVLHSRKMSGNGRRSARSRIKSSTDGDEGEPLRPRRTNLKNRRDQNSLRLFRVDVRIMLGLSIFSLLTISFLIYRLVNSIHEADTPRVVTPFPAPKLMDLPVVKLNFMITCIFFCYVNDNYLFLKIRDGYISFKVSIKRACTGELIALTFILEFAPGSSSHLQRI